MSRRKTTEKVSFGLVLVQVVTINLSPASLASAMIWMVLILRVLLDFGSKVRAAAPNFCLESPPWLLAVTAKLFMGWGERATYSGREPPDWNWWPRIGGMRSQLTLVGSKTYGGLLLRGFPAQRGELPGACAVAGWFSPCL